MTLNPYIVWPLAVVFGACAALAYWVLSTDATTMDVVGYVLCAIGGVVVGKISEARHPAHFGPNKEMW